MSDCRFHEIPLKCTLFYFHVFCNDCRFHEIHTEVYTFLALYPGSSTEKQGGAWLQGYTLLLPCIQQWLQFHKIHTKVYTLITQHHRCWPEIIPSLPCPYFHIFAATVKVGMDCDGLGTTLHRCDNCVQECMIVKVKLVSKGEPTAMCLLCISSAAWL